MERISSNNFNASLYQIELDNKIKEIKLPAYSIKILQAFKGLLLK